MLDSKLQLTITLTEPVLFLRSSDPSGRHQSDPNDPFTLVRGILNLHVTKPVGISSIEVDLTGVLTIISPEGIGASRVEIPEKQKIFSSAVTIFRADQGGQFGKRRASVGPGLGLSLANCKYNDQCRETVLVSPPPSPRGRPVRRNAVSVPPDLGPTPPYTPVAQPVSPIQSGLCAHAENPAQTLEELRQALRDNVEVHGNEFAPLPSRRHSIALAQPSTPAHCNVYRASNEGLHRENNIRGNDMSTPAFDSPSSRNSLEEAPLSPNHLSHPYSPEHAHGAYPRTHERNCDTPTSRSRLHLSLNSVLCAVREATSKATSMTRAFSGPEERERGRSRVRNVVDRQDVVETGDCVAAIGDSTGEGNLSHRSCHAEHREHYLLGLGRVLGLERNHREKERDCGRKFKEHEGWTEFMPGTYSYPVSFLLPPNLPPTFSVPHGSLSYTIKAVVHRPGAFTSKLSCQVPLLVVAAPAIGVGEGGDPGPIFVQKQWEAKLAYSLGLSSRLFLVGSRRHLGAAAYNGIYESAESLVQAEVEARTEPGYGTVMLDLTLLPLEKVKIWKLSVVVDQHIKHIDDLGRLYRNDEVKRVPLLELQDTCLAEEIGEDEQTRKNKQKGEDGVVHVPLLPTPLSPHRSPLLRHVPLNSDPSVLAGPGPYTFSTNIGLPGCDGSSGGLNFTVKHKSSDIKVDHFLRLVLRVEPVGDQDTNDHVEGDKKKLFDIAVQTPITILSCRCAPEYQTLPRYSQFTQDSSESDDPTCPCEPISDVVQLAEQGHVGVEHHEHLTGHQLTPSSTLSSECNDSYIAAVSHCHSHQALDVGQPHQHQHNGHHGLAHSRSSSHRRQSSHVSPPLSPTVATRETHGGPAGPGAVTRSWSRSPSVHTHDRGQSHSHPGAQHHHGHPHPHAARSHPHSRRQTPLSTPHPSRPPSPVLAQRYERLVSGLESDAGEAPPSYYESIDSSSNF